ncbi:hypothetical protein KKF81_02745 [Candidatus Micrarchaeota archaeon]|nr:hypothetical protein [Candidatus Micrarchaeota archaeon]
MRKSQVPTVRPISELIRSGCKAAYERCGFGKLGGGLVEYAFKHTDPADDRFSPATRTLVNLLKSDKTYSEKSTALSQIDDPDVIVELFHMDVFSDPAIAKAHLLKGDAINVLTTMLRTGKLDNNEDALWVLIDCDSYSSTGKTAISKTTDIPRLCSYGSDNAISYRLTYVANRLAELPDAANNQDALVLITLHTDNEGSRNAAFEKLSPDSLVRLAISTDQSKVAIAAIEKIGFDVEKLVAISKGYPGNWKDDIVKSIVNILVIHVAEITDNNALALIASNSYISEQYIAAIKAISSDVVLCELMETTRTRLHATLIEKLETMFSNGDVSNDMAKALLVIYSNDDKTKRQAFDSITRNPNVDPNALLKIAGAFGCDYSSAANTILCQMVYELDLDSYPDVLDFIALKGTDQSAREKAFCKICDHDALQSDDMVGHRVAFIMDNTEHGGVIRLGVEYLEAKFEISSLSYAGLETLACYTRNEAKGKQAVDALGDYLGRLREIAKSDSALPEVAEHAASKIFTLETCTESTLTDIYNASSSGQGVKILVLAYLESISTQLEKEDNLFIVASKSQNAEHCRTAISALSGLDSSNDFVHELIAIEHPSQSIAHKSARKIHDSNCIIKVAKNTPHLQAALAVLGNLSITNSEVGPLLEDFIGFNHANSNVEPIMEKARELKRRWNTYHHSLS